MQTRPRFKASFEGLVERGVAYFVNSYIISCHTASKLTHVLLKTNIFQMIIKKKLPIAAFQVKSVVRLEFPLRFA